MDLIVHIIVEEPLGVQADRRQTSDEYMQPACELLHGG